MTGMAPDIISTSAPKSATLAKLSASRTRITIIALASLAVSTMAGFELNAWDQNRKAAAAAQARKAAEAKIRFEERKKSITETFTGNVQSITQAFNDSGLCQPREAPWDSCNAGQRTSYPHDEEKFFYFYTDKKWAYHPPQHYAHNAHILYSVESEVGSKPVYRLSIDLSTRGAPMKDFNPVALTLVTRLAGDVLGDRKAAGNVIEACLAKSNVTLPDDEEKKDKIDCTYTYDRSVRPGQIFSTELMRISVTSRNGRALNPGQL